MKLEDGDRVIGAFEAPDLSFSPEECDAWAAARAKTAARGDLRKAAGADLHDRLEPIDFDVLQVCSSGHMKRTSIHAYRRMRRDGRGVNDKGPAKVIGDVVAFLPIERGSEEVFVQTSSGRSVSVALADVKVAPKATTGTKPVDGFEATA
jgi:DNA gyrase/topoisomerase IV subunit A